MSQLLGLTALFWPDPVLTVLLGLVVLSWNWYVANQHYSLYDNLDPADAERYLRDHWRRIVWDTARVECIATPCKVALLYWLVPALIARAGYSYTATAAGIVCICIYVARESGWPSNTSLRSASQALAGGVVFLTVVLLTHTLIAVVAVYAAGNLPYIINEYRIISRAVTGKSRGWVISFGGRTTKHRVTFS